MLSVNINRDVEQYEETIAFGLNASQTIAAIISIIVCIVVTCLLHFILGLSMGISIYLSLPACLFIMLPTLGRRNGLTVIEQIKKTNQKKDVLLYDSGIQKKQEDRERQKYDADKKRKCKKTEKKDTVA